MASCPLELEGTDESTTMSSNSSVEDVRSESPKSADASGVNPNGAGAAINGTKGMAETAAGNDGQRSSVDNGEAGQSTHGVEQGIDSLLQRHRREIMFELRRLQMGERPVTGQSNREAVENFFLQQSQELSGAGAAAPRNRPERVLVEVQGLVERRPVSSILQSAQFRRRLERTVRNSLQNARIAHAVQHADLYVQQHQQQQQRGREASSTPEPATLPTAFQQQSFAAAAGPAPAQHSSSASQLQSEVSIAPAASTVSAAPNAVRSTDSSHEVSPVDAESADVAEPDEEPVAGAQALPVAAQNHTQAWVQQQPLPGPRSMQPQLQWDTVEEVQHEALVSEISELVHSQLVTSALEGEFRNHMETHIQQMIMSSGIDGRRAQEALASLPRGRVPRNDFSHLGINPGIMADAASLSDNLDNVSIISATAAVHVPYQQTTTAMSRELQALKSQMNELKSMMKMNFDLQLDIQRAIRQEVAAAMASAFANHPQLASGSLPSRPVDDSRCLICLEKKADSVLYQCGHLCVCHTCGMRLKSRNDHCPVCRAPIKDILRAYKC